MKQLQMLAIISVFSLSLLACTNQEVGTGVGAAAGAGIGHAISNDGWGAAAGAGIGALLGNQIGKSYDE